MGDVPEDGMRYDNMTTTPLGVPIQTTLVATSIDIESQSVGQVTRTGHESVLGTSCLDLSIAPSLLICLAHGGARA